MDTFFMLEKPFLSIYTISLKPVFQCMFSSQTKLIILQKLQVVETVQHYMMKIIMAIITRIQTTTPVTIPAMLSASAVPP